MTDEAAPVKELIPGACKLSFTLPQKTLSSQYSAIFTAPCSATKVLCWSGWHLSFEIDVRVKYYYP